MDFASQSDLEAFWEDIKEHRALIECSSKTVLHLMTVARDRYWLGIRTVARALETFNLNSWLKEF